MGDVNLTELEHRLRLAVATPPRPVDLVPAVTRAVAAVPPPRGSAGRVHVLVGADDAKLRVAILGRPPVTYVAKVHAAARRAAREAAHSTVRSVFR